jgi:hypothetical protein
MPEKSSVLDNLPGRYEEYIPPKSEVPDDVSGEDVDSYRAIRAIIGWAKENTSDSDEVIARKVMAAARMGELSAEMDFPEAIDFFPN